MQQLPAGLPPVLAVENQLKQVFLNLILNAAEAMLASGTLTISAEAEGADVHIEFADTGTGLPADVLAHLFEPFFTTKADGSGLGLAVSHEIVANHGGLLPVRNAPAGGAIFTVTLPIHSAAVAEERYG